MTEIRFVAKEIAASRQRGIPTDEGKLWETLRLDAERAAAGEEMLRGFLDLEVLRHDGFASGLGLLLARKLADYSMPAERLGEIARVLICLVSRARVRLNKSNANCDSSIISICGRPDTSG